MVLAHQGGWDEIGFALLPLAIVGVILWLANRRANAARRANGADNGTVPPEP